MKLKKRRFFAKKYSNDPAIRIAASLKDGGYTTTWACVHYQEKKGNIDRVYVNGKRIR